MDKDKYITIEEWEKRLENMALMKSYECPECYAHAGMLPEECCDHCILKFYLQDLTAPHLIWED